MKIEFGGLLICSVLVLMCRGREMQRRLAEREIEIGMDNRDRHKEKEELEELKAKIYSGDSNNPDYEFAKVFYFIFLSYHTNA